MAQGLLRTRVDGRLENTGLGVETDHDDMAPPVLCDQICPLLCEQGVGRLVEDRHGSRNQVLEFIDDVSLGRTLHRAPADQPLKQGFWTPRELRHSFVSLLSESGLTIEQISLLVGYKSTQVTETVYRHQLRPVLTEGAEAMDDLLPANR